MEIINPWREILNILSNDDRINVWHLAIVFAIIHLSKDQDLNKTINISRRKVMVLSHIKNLMTYHKYIKELQVFGYLKYLPSYHPKNGSKVQIII